MKTSKNIIVVLLTLLVFVMLALSQEETRDKSVFPVLTGSYLGQKPPGTITEPFAPDLLPDKYWWHSAPAFSPDGKEVYFSAFIRNKAYSERIMYMKLENGRWTPPKVAPFSDYFEGGPCFTLDGNKIFFSSARPLFKGEERREDRDIWYVERTPDGWSEPKHTSFNTDTWEDRVYISDLGNIYYKSNNDIYRVKMINGKFSKPERLSNAINSEYGEQDPCIAPDESYMIFYSSRPGHLGKEDGDLYISFKKKDGTWTKAVNMGPTFNEGHIITRFPRLSPDGKYLFFSKLIGPRNDKIYWVDVKIIEELKSKRLQLSPNDVKLQILYDNNPYVDDLQTDPGFSCLIKIKNRTLLFDAGRIGKILMSNIEKLEINPADIEKIVISHNHSDHICGLPVLLKECNKPEVYIVKAMANNVSDYAQGLIDESINSAEKHASKVIKTTEPLKICDNVYTTGVMGARIPEQALIIQTDAGLIVITGCAHPGVVELTRKAKELLKQDVLLVIGGFHLMGKQPEDIQKVVTDISNLTHHIAPCHCSGDVARELFKRKFGKNYIKAGVGKIINCSELTRSKKN